MAAFCLLYGASLDGDDQQQQQQPLRICMFKCSLVSATHPTQLFADLYAFCPPTWYAHWENCGTRTMKKLRTLIRRPSALPAMVELSKPSWVLLSGSTAGQPKSLCDAKSAAGKSYKQIKPLAGTDLLIVVQVHGRIQLKLTPTRSRCFLAAAAEDHDNTNSRCQSLETVSLAAGQMAVVSAKYWSLSYRPVTSTAAASTAEECSTNEKEEEGTFNLSIILAGIHV
ncbi:Septin-4 [Tyrophagus putrescentiae]|nr:Septin-4 [Tyrophagus putrescentiae]